MNYEGLSSNAKIGIIATSALVAVLNLVCAWLIANSLISDLHLSEDDVVLIDAVAEFDDPGVAVNRLYLRTHVINTHGHLKLLANKQALLVLVIGTGFALIAVGFALFIIGADGAFQFQGEANGATVVFAGTSPGLVCFILATILIAFAFSRDYEFTPGEPSYLYIPSQSNNSLTSSGAEVRRDPITIPESP